MWYWFGKLNDVKDLNNQNLNDLVTGDSTSIPVQEDSVPAMSVTTAEVLIQEVGATMAEVVVQEEDVNTAGIVVQEMFVTMVEVPFQELSDYEECWYC